MVNKSLARVLHSSYAQRRACDFSFFQTGQEQEECRARGSAAAVVNFLRKVNGNRSSFEFELYSLVRRGFFETKKRKI